MPQPHAAHLPSDTSTGEPLVRVEQMTRVIATRAQQTIILDDVTFSVPTRSLFAINGPSGSGRFGRAPGDKAGDAGCSTVSSLYSF